MRLVLGYNAAMHPLSPEASPVSQERLVWLYGRTMAVYLVAMFVLWRIGLEGIYGHPTPFYALYAPTTGTVWAAGLTALLLSAGYVSFCRSWSPATVRAFLFGTVLIGAASLALSFWSAHAAGQSLYGHLRPYVMGLVWQFPAMLVAGAGAFLFHRRMLPFLAADGAPEGRTVWKILAGLCLYSIVFACAIAMIRGGVDGIAHAYGRTSYEYIGDIGKTRGIQALFTQYLDIHEHLSMHAKVHPPGPITLLWLFSLFLLSTSPLVLSLATVVFSATAIFPLYGWTKRLTDARTALIACLCYVLVPSVVLFTATSADALFTPFTLTTLYCFERAIRSRSARFALAAGVGYGMMALLKYSLIGIGAYFGLVGLWLLRSPETRRNVVQTAALMIVGSGAVLWGVYLWSGFNNYEAFLVAKAQFDLDQAHLDDLSPRLPAWTYRILNPACWFYFAGIPVSLLFLKALFHAGPADRARWVVFVLTLIALNVLYLARGEGERSALYLIPFLVVPAARYLERVTAGGRHAGPLWATLAFLGFQCWFTETVFYTYW